MNDPIFDLMANDAYLSVGGRTQRERVINNAKRNFENKVVNHPGYVEEALRNGKPQKFLVTMTEFNHKCKVTAFPDEEIHSGDILDFFDSKWIVMETRTINAIQMVGTAWMCNYKFRFQTFSPEIHECWGVLDNGVYSTTRTSDATIMTLDMQYKIYLPSNEITDLLHQDQRLAVDKWKDQHGNDILLTYEITGRDRISDNYAKGGHLLVLNIRGSSYNPYKDNLDEMICDYISESDKTQLPNCVITGRDYIRIGSSRSYKVGTSTCGDEVKPLDIDPLWNVEADPGITITPSVNSVILTVPDNIGYLGTKVKLILIDQKGKYAPGEFLIEVTA